MLHIITGLGLGGAETLLASLVRHPGVQAFEHSVISLLDEGHFGPALRSSGVSVSCLHLSREKPSVSSGSRLRRLVQDAAPDLIHCWMYHPALLHALISPTLPPIPVVWGLHHTTNDGSQVSRRTLGVVRATAILAHFVPDEIACCSYSTREHHAEIGFPVSKLSVILNGVDLQVFRQNIAARDALRNEWEFPSDSFVVGHVGRFNPQKDHVSFVRAAAQFAASVDSARFVMCGRNVDSRNTELRGEIERAGLGERVRLLGERSDMPSVFSGMDAFAMSSAFGEALPIALLEAMSAGVVALATDVGDCRAVIGDDSRVVPARRPELLAAALLTVFRLSPQRRGEMSREGIDRVKHAYSIGAMAQRHFEMYDRLLDRRR